MDREKRQTRTNCTNTRIDRSMETWVETEGQRGPVKENVLTTDRGNADWAEIRHRTAGTPFPYLLAGLKKSTQPTSTEPMKCRRYILSINAQQISSFERVYRIVHYRVVSHFSLYNSVYLSAWCAVKLQKKLGISSRCHNEKVISLQVNKLRFLVYRVLLG